MPHLLLIEDDKQLAESIVALFEEDGFDVDHASDGALGLDFAINNTYHVAIVDIMVPKLSGLEVIQALRRRRDQLPILILSALDHIESRVEGLKTGADDYLVKPFSIAELKARIFALLRRADQSPRDLQVADLSLNYATREVTRQGELIELQNREFELLSFLMEHQGQIVSKKMIIRDVWHFNFDPQTNIVEARMSKLRDKIDRPFETPLIQTIRGAGYVLGPPSEPKSS